MMHNGWGNVQYALASVEDDPQNDTKYRRTLHFERGGYQHGRGGAVSSFYVENQLELLDSPGEWFFDEANQTLYVWPNGTDAAGASAAATAAATATGTSTRGTEGEGGGELYNRASGVRWSASSGDKYVGNLNLD